jgi:hypothetical protein
MIRFSMSPLRSRMRKVKGKLRALGDLAQHVAITFFRDPQLAKKSHTIKYRRIVGVLVYVNLR